MARPSNFVELGGHSPQVHADAWIAPTAMLIGEVEIAAGASVFYGTVVRADQARIFVGAGSNLQDLVAVHADPDFPVQVGAGVSVGHGAILHGCTIEDDCLIGMGAIVLNGAIIGAGSLVAAGALVVGGTVVPPRSLVTGSPGKVRRPLSDPEFDANKLNASHYVELASLHQASWK